MRRLQEFHEWFVRARTHPVAGGEHRLVERRCILTFIGETDAEALVLHKFGTFSRRDRSHLLIRLDEITRIDAGADYERSIAYLSARRG